MIIFQNGVETIKTRDALYSSDEAIRKMATMLIVDMAEANTDMICDMQDEYKSKADIERVFQNLNEQTIDVFEDHFDYLKIKMLQYLRTANVTARVRRLEYDVDGRLSDVTVEVAVEAGKTAA
jgi:vacuolar-type H+-ATPase catalytic subunit A/Vma1